MGVWSWPRLSIAEQEPSLVETAFMPSLGTRKRQTFIYS
jgi:hypothetical protein